MSVKKRKVLYDGKVTRCFYCRGLVYSNEDLAMHRSCELKLKENPIAGNQQDDEFPPDPDQQV